MQLQSSTDLRDVLRFNVGTDLYLLDRASPTAVEQNVTLRETQGMGDVMGVEISADGDAVLFAMRGPFDPNLNADESADLEYLGVRDRDRHAAPHHCFRHHGRSRPGHLAALSARRTDPVLVDATAAGQGDPARRGQAAVRGAGRGSHEPGVRAARHGRRRQQPTSDLLQSKPRSRPDACSTTAKCCSVAGTMPATSTGSTSIR